MLFYHKKAVRDQKLPRWNQIQNYGDTTPSCPPSSSSSSSLKEKLTKSPTMPYMAVTSMVKALTDHLCDGHPDHSHSKMSYNK